MSIRRPVVAGSFYQAGKDACSRSVGLCLRGYEPPDDLGKVLGGVVPHAGWTYSGPTAGKVFLALKKAADPGVFVLFGAVHQWGVSGAAVYPSGAWSTPLGDVPVDEGLAGEIVDAGPGLIDASEQAHEAEHSIEVQVPFIKRLFPEARIVPILVTPDERSASVGAAVGKVLQAGDRRAVVVASTDLTHYGMGYFGQSHGPLPGALQWMKANDGRFIRLVEELNADEIVAEAARNHNACGAGAVAAAIAAVQEMGATRARVLEYITSAEVVNDLSSPNAVGYAALVFTAPGD